MTEVMQESASHVAKMSAASLGHLVFIRCGGRCYAFLAVLRSIKNSMWQLFSWNDVVAAGGASRLYNYSGG
jgi:hypothetical protein